METYARTLKDLDGDQVGEFRDAVRPGTNGTGAVSSMAKPIVMADARNGIVSKASTASKIDVIDVDTAIDDIGISPSSGAVIIDVVGSASVAAGNTSKAPG